MGRNHQGGDVSRERPQASSGGPGASRGSRRGAWLEPLLRVPLAAKLVGANAMIVAAAMLVSFVGGESALQEGRFAILLVAVLVVSSLVNVILVVIALRPLRSLESVATRINRGDLAARVPESSLADADMRRIGSTFNTVLDGLTHDRERLRILAKQVIKAGDRERAHIARELHDSTAQTLAALMLELSVLASENSDSRLNERIERVRKIVADVLDEVKLLAHTVHPRVLDDMGLPAAIRLLGREAEQRSNVQVVVESQMEDEQIDQSSSSTVYRVAQEAVSNALRHSRARNLTIRLATSGANTRLAVEDDGTGFDIAAAEERRPGMGLFTMRERAELVGGSLSIDSHPGRGTRVVATVPTAVNAAAQSKNSLSHEPTLERDSHEW